MKHRASRFVFEALFLVVVSVALTIADLSTPEVIGMMLLGWIIVALFEWAAWLDEPHFGSGLPPRFYVPQVALPPALVVEQASSGYPAAKEDEDEATWITSPAAWAEALDEWPVLESSPVGEQTEIALPVALEEADDEEGALAPELDASILTDPVAPHGEPVPEPEREPEPEPGPEPALEQMLEPKPKPKAKPKPERSPVTPEVVAVPVTARHRIDPLTAPQRGRLRRRGARDDIPVVEVPDRPPMARSLPGRARGEG